MSIFDSGEPKGPGLFTRLSLRMPKSANLWKWALLILTLFCPLFITIGEISVVWGVAFSYTGASQDWGWFIVFQFGSTTGQGPVYLVMYSLWLPVLLGLYMLNKMVKKRARSRLAGLSMWYYFLLVVGAFLIFMITAGFGTGYGLGIPVGLVPWFLMFLRYKQLNYYLGTLDDTEKAGRDITKGESTTDIPVKVASGYDIAGESLKLAVKVSNEGNVAILNVTVNLDMPDGFEFTRGTMPSQKIGNINAGSFQSAIFWLKPMRCVDDKYGGSVIFRDPKNKSHTVIIPSKRIVNVCPMLESTEDVEAVFKKLKFGSLTRNCASFKFEGSAKTVHELAKSRLRGLDPVDRSTQILDDGNFLGYACYVGETKFGEKYFAAEIQTTGSESSGVLTLSVYSDDERILSGYMVDVMQDVREHVEVVEEQACPLATCPKCGADIDPTKIGDSRVYICSYCGGASKAAPWLT